MATDRVASIEERTAAAEALGAALARRYREIAERSMRDLPVYNPALGVAAVGFHDDGGRVVGIIATPWFMNVTLVASRFGPALEPAPFGAVVAYELPSGIYDFVVGALDGFGRIDTLSLFSPMFEFADGESAMAAAEAAMAEIRRPSEPASAPTVRTPEVLDRRALLFGRRPGAGVAVS